MVYAAVGSLMMPGKEPQLDGLRACAVLWVILCHGGQQVGAWGSAFVPPPPLTWDGRLHFSLGSGVSLFFLPIANGYLGVDVFFTLSGYLIGSILCDEYRRNKSISWGSFLLRRQLRIGPMLLVYVALTVRHTNCWWVDLLYIQNLNGQCYDITWSVTIEAQFYVVSVILFALYVRVIQRWELFSFVIKTLVLVSIAARLYMHTVVLRSEESAGIKVLLLHSIYTQLPCRMAPYLSGMAAAIDVAYVQKASSRCTNMLAMWCLVYVTLIGYTFVDPFRLIYSISVPVVFGLCLGHLIKEMHLGGFPLVRRMLSAACWVPIARISYSMYLLQFFGFRIAEFACRRIGIRIHFGYFTSGQTISSTTSFSLLGYVVFTGIACLTTVCAAICTYIVIEYPCMKYRPHLAVRDDSRTLV